MPFPNSNPLHTSQSITSGSGLLKNDYSPEAHDKSPMDEALAKHKQRLAIILKAKAKHVGSDVGSEGRNPY